MKQGTPSSPPAPIGGAEVASMGDGETVAEGAAAMTSPSAGTCPSISYLHSTRSRDPSTSTSISSITGIVEVAAGVARRGSITAPVTVEAGVVCHSNSPAAPAGEDASCIIKGGVVLIATGVGGRHETLVVEVTWGAVPLPPLARSLTVSSNGREPLADRRT